MGRLSNEKLALWVAASCSASGVPVKITDTRVLAQVAVLLTGRGPGSPQGAEADTGTAQNRHTGITRSGSNDRAPGVPGAITA